MPHNYSTCGNCEDNEEFGVQVNLPNVLYACLWGAQKSPGVPLGPSKSGKKRLGVGRIMPILVLHLAQGTQVCPETLQGILQQRLEAARSMAHNARPYYALGKGIFRNSRWLAASPLIRRDCHFEWKKALRAGTHDDRRLQSRPAAAKAFKV